MFSGNYPIVSGREYDDNTTPTTLMVSSEYNKWPYIELLSY